MNKKKIIIISIAIVLLIAAGYSSASATAVQWRNSEGHYQNMIGSYTRIGVGVVSLSGTTYGTYWVQLFA